MAKLMMPETENRNVRFDAAETGDEAVPVNIFEAIGNGAATGLKLALNVGAMLLAFVSLVFLLNGLMSGIGAWFGIEGLTLQWILG